MGARKYNLVKNVNFKSGEICLEIGSERGEGSTKYLRSFCNERGIKFYSVDIEPTEIGVLKMSGEDFLDNFNGVIKFAYLDNFDYIFKDIEEAEFVKEQKVFYKTHGFELNNKNSQYAHLQQAIKIAKHCVHGSQILIDDTFYDNGWSGKGGLAVPFLRGVGFIYKEIGRNYILMEKNENSNNRTW